MEGICKRARFLEKSWMEFAKESASWERTRRNWQKSPVPGEKLAGIHKRVPFLEKSSKEFARGCRRCPGCRVRLIFGNQAGEQPQSFLVGFWEIVPYPAMHENLTC